MGNLFLLRSAAFRLVCFFLPFFVGYARIFDQQVERFAIAQPASDATFASLLCQDCAHLFRRLSRGVSDRVDLIFDLLIARFDFFFIRETFQHAQQTGKLSFPPTVTESFRPYVKERLVRNDADDEPFFEDGEETEDWSPGAADADDDADEETGLIDRGGRAGAAPGIDLDDENEE